MILCKAGDERIVCLSIWPLEHQQAKVNSLFAGALRHILNKKKHLRARK